MVMDVSPAPKSHSCTELTIAICDDDRQHSALLERLLLSYAQKRGLTPHIMAFADGQALLACGESFHILFLAARLPGMDGLETAYRLRLRDPHFLLVLMSADMKYAPMGYEVRAFRFLLKHQPKAVLERYMDAALETLGMTRQSVWLPFVGGGCAVYMDEILFVESQKHVAHFHLAVPHRALYLYETLDNIAGVLPGDEFVRIHQSYLVGLRYLDKVKGYTAYLRGGRTLPVSQKRFAGVKRAWLHYIKTK